jgi:hypothetical protein
MKKENRDIRTFKFTCVHDWRGQVSKVTDGCSGIYYPMEEIRVSPKWVENLGFWVHEFAEAALIEVLTKMKYDYHVKVQYAEFKSTYIAHFITPLGGNNGCNLEPATKKNTIRW